MTIDQLKSLKTNNLVAWHYTNDIIAWYYTNEDVEDNRELDLYGFPDDLDRPPLVGIVVEANEKELIVAWGDDITRKYKYPALLRAVKNLEKLS